MVQARLSRKADSMRHRLRFFFSHLAISALAVGSAAALVVFVWYPPPFAQLENIYSILLVMAGVDVGAGPLCTLVAASPTKPRAHLARDLAIIGCVQLAALGYGLHTAFTARPVYAVYSAGQFEIERANELSATALSKATGTPFASLPLFGPAFVEARFPADKAEVARIVLSAVQGGPDIKDMPRYYLPWPAPGTDAAKHALAVSRIPRAGPLHTAIARILREKHVPANEAITLPINGKIDRGTVILRRSDLTVIGIVPGETP